MNLKLLRDIFLIPKKERHISLYLLLITNIVISIFYFSEEQKFSSPVIIKNIEEGQDGTRQIESKDTSTDTIRPVKLIVNTMTFEDWKKEGFSDKQASMILSYRKKIGKFSSEGDLEKVYCVSDSYIVQNSSRFVFGNIQEDFQNTQKGEVIESGSRGDSVRQDQKFSKEKEDLKKQKLDLNSCTKEELESVYGIGSKLSTRILKYRDLLGGYIKIEQLNEVYGIRDDRYGQIKGQFEIRIRNNQINLNSADFKTLIRHPYLTKSEVNAILNYREQHGVFDKVSELKKIYSISDSIFVKIEPYLIIQ